MNINKAEFIRELQGVGIKKNSKSYHDYEAGKAVIARLVTTADQYDQFIKVLTDYVRV